MREQVYRDPRPAEYFVAFHERARSRRPTWVYELTRVVVGGYLLVVHRATCAGTLMVPASGPAIIAPNHYSFLDHFIVALYLRRRLRFMAKSQLFRPPLRWWLAGVGAFPVRRGQRDEEAFRTAHAILADGGVVVMYAEGGRSRSGRPGRARPGIGRLALESGAPVVPTAIVGSERARHWRRLVLPSVFVAYGEPLRYERVAHPTREQAARAAEEIFAEVVALQDEAARARPASALAGAVAAGRRRLTALGRH